jgi:hypothetical protein
MTMFVHHAIVHCGKDRCWHGEANGVQSVHCQYIRFEMARGRGMIDGTQTEPWCKLFGVKLDPVPGTGSPARCDECLAAEGMFRVEGRTKP